MLVKKIVKMVEDLQQELWYTGYLKELYWNGKCDWCTWKQVTRVKHGRSALGQGYPRVKEESAALASATGGMWLQLCIGGRDSQWLPYLQKAMHCFWIQIQILLQWNFWAYSYISEVVFINVIFNFFKYKCLLSCDLMNAEEQNYSS